MSLKNKDTTLDLPHLFHEFLIPWRKLPLPLSSDDLGHLPVCLEIGFGNGEFLISQAIKEPKEFWLGIEVSYISIKKAIKRAKRAGLKRLRILKGDGRSILYYALPSFSLKEVYVLFPDPWPKKRHEKKRLLNSEFLSLLASRLIPKGKLTVETDDRQYREFFLKEILKSATFDILVDSINPEASIETKYKRKWKKSGREVYHLELERKESVPEIQNPRLEFGKMPHEIISLDISMERLLEAFKPMVQKSPNAVLSIKEVFVSGTGREAIFLVYVDEGPLNQQVLIRAAKRRGELVIKLDYLGDPLITDGVKDAVREVARFIREIAYAD